MNRQRRVSQNMEISVTSGYRERELSRKHIKETEAHIQATLEV